MERYKFDRSAEIRYHLLRGPIILPATEVGMVVRLRGYLLGFGDITREMFEGLKKPMPSAAVFHGVRIMDCQFLPNGRILLNPERKKT